LPQIFFATSLASIHWLHLLAKWYNNNSVIRPFANSL
jgi:transcription elongation factor Elf1